MKWIKQNRSMVSKILFVVGVLLLGADSDNNLLYLYLATMSLTLIILGYKLSKKVEIIPA